MVNALKNVSHYIEKMKVENVYNNGEYKKTYDMNENSIFLDIGSGMGKPCLHLAVSVDCLSFGIELV